MSGRPVTKSAVNRSVHAKLPNEARRMFIDVSIGQQNGRR